MFNGGEEEHLVKPEWLQEKLGAAGLRVVDMRGYVITDTRSDGLQTAVYRGARDEYLNAHIPGAVYLDWTRDIVDSDDPVPVQAAGEEKIRSVFSAAGIGEKTLVVAYDNHPSSQFAARLWWLLKYYGHDRVRVLNGGWGRWNAEGRPTEAGETRTEPALFVPRRDAALRKTWQEVVSAIDKGTVLIDARDEGQFEGRIRRGPRGGHIPRAINVPREFLTKADATWKSPDQIRAVFESRGVCPADEVIAYCNGGVAATSVLFALSMAGYRKISNYDGSWNEWGSRPDLPILPNDEAPAERR